MSKNFNHKIKVYYEDTDAGGVVYYANYLKYLERARTEALINIGLSNLKIKDNFKALIIVKSCNINYKKSAYLEDELSIKSHILSITKTNVANTKVCMVTHLHVLCVKTQKIFEKKLQLTKIRNFLKVTSILYFNV